MLAEFWAYDPSQVIGGFPPLAALWTLVARGQAIDTQYPGVRFLYGSGWWEYDFYIGVGRCRGSRRGPGGRAPGLAAGGGGRRVPAPLARLARGLGIPESLGVRAGVAHPEEPSRSLALAGTRALRLHPLCRSRTPAPVGVCGARRGTGGWRRPWRSPWWPSSWWTSTWRAASWQRIALADAPLSREHRPPLSYDTPVGGTEVELLEFTPNRLVYSIETPRPQLVTLPFQWQQRDEWTLGGASWPGNTGTAWRSRCRRAGTRSRCAFGPACWARESRSARVTLCAVVASFALPRRSRERLLDVLGGPEVLARDASTDGGVG